ncbi:uncharacterized domain 1-containing protein [Desulfatibacillum alkenivorans DSM 16219]|uniref:Uncharacterized domain 1-containing protein n=1 Tax=Desulfatibacillum alkenivorans DSM 16219 TaxID=1121393 RepID=A0A1M6ZH45_9BACT|nr:PaaI family thioesterase [Desulfatibacillum alkenivorans]SHL29828.1 uncharacterized domain 1-containing protein [Desulfatibacillum alkenivorans DSM 16219]
MSKRLREVISNPLHVFLGVTDIQSENGCGEIILTINKNVINPQGTLHGGIIYTLSDVCAYAGLLSLLDDDTEAVTHDIQVSVMRSAMLGDEIRFKSEVIKRGRSICFLQTKVTLGEKIIATAKITKSLIPMF